ncbi:MAG TPA: LuxR C-terminal-related transcriptional regulator [Bacteroidales bacterium]|nr:LuxR C-terminal-related transcriptional regulator [Bacteroidales bacterium]
MKKATFVIFDKSYIIRKGIASIIEKIENTQLIQLIDQEDEILSCIKNDNPDFLIFNPHTLSNVLLNKLSSLTRKTKQIALITDSESIANYSNYAEVIDINNTQSEILKKINQLIGEKEIKKTSYNYHEEISTREADIVKYIALGFSNKEIADKLFLSAHTVVTHRKNITRKLGIKTVPGLTIYAILNKIIDIDDTQ